MDEKAIIEKENKDFVEIDDFSKKFYSLLKEFSQGLPKEGKEILEYTNQFELQGHRKPFNSGNIIRKLSDASKFNINAIQKDRSMFILLKEASTAFDEMTFQKANSTLKDANIIDILPRSVFDVLNKLEELDVFIEYVNRLELLKKEESLIKIDNSLKNKVISISESSLINNKCNDYLDFENDETSLKKEIIIAKNYINLYEECINCPTFEDENLKNYAKNQLDDINCYLNFLQKENIKTK